MKERSKRQSFLGPASDDVIAATRIGIVGYGGGGSHIGQQLAHIGFGNVVVADPDVVEESNLNRLVGAAADDVRLSTPKVDVARRVITALLPDAQPHLLWKPWEEAVCALRTADILIGCVDSFGQRAALERFARRFLIPYIDIGMDVLSTEAGYQVIGQVALSTPGHACLRCLGIINDETLQNEERARMYGEAGDKPQVVWPNAVLASTAVGLAVQLLMPWGGEAVAEEYLEYDGNRGTLQRAPRLEVLRKHRLTCTHYRLSEVGDPMYAMRPQPAA